MWIKIIRSVGSDFNNRVYKDQKNYERIDERQFGGCWIHHRLLSQYLCFDQARFMPLGALSQLLETNKDSNRRGCEFDR